MRLFTSLFAATALITSVVAQGRVAFTQWPHAVTVGQPATLTWSGGSNSPVTITLKKGDSNDLKDVKVLTSDAQGGTFQWTPSPDLTDGSDYAFQITQDGQVNYSGLVTLSGGSVSTAPVSAAAAASATSIPATTVHSAASSSTLTAAVTSSSTTASTNEHKDGTLTSKTRAIGTGSVTVPRNATFKPATLSSTTTIGPVAPTAAASKTSAAKNASETASTGDASSLTGSVALILSLFAAFYVM
ncbi:hypothetical protein Plec18167_004035 [Paecilomyces lecythidis]|uniref:Yeast cell wall synthesis Kre9/Knh1-like N-terminal domain-containing protein n=1 Tax=Paecilomyces lecythidis TaxID=3004212 RepID=A0ABR3XVK0_9EURO